MAGISAKEYFFFRFVFYKNTDYVCDAPKPLRDQERGEYITWPAVLSFVSGTFVYITNRTVDIG
jgi:hypothetical protein